MELGSAAILPAKASGRAATPWSHWTPRKISADAAAAGTATNIHMEGPGMFFVTGPEVKFIDIGLLDRLLHEMVKMSPLQGSRFEVVPTSDEMGIIGAAVNADRATQE